MRGRQCCCTYRGKVDVIARATALCGGTLGFVAPEVQRMGGTTKADMYALGATVAAVIGASPDTNGLNDFIAKLMSKNVADRLDAPAALHHNFFAPVYGRARARLSKILEHPTDLRSWPETLRRRDELQSLGWPRPRARLGV